MSENLPDGKTCADCVSFKRICEITGVEPDQRSCNWVPSRFIDVSEELEPVTQNISDAMAFPFSISQMMSGSSMVKCIECMYYVVEGCPNGGECRRNPPVIIPGLGTRWPTPNDANHNGGCGKGVPRSAPTFFPKK